MTKDEALRLALEALKQIDEAMPFPVAKLAQKVIKEALAQTEPNYKKALEAWLDKTEWVQETVKPHELGMHRADVLKQRIEEALAQPEQEPVAFVKGWNCGRLEVIVRSLNQRFEIDQPLYTTPPQRTLVELDEEDYIKAYELCDFDKIAAFEFFEAKLKEKNNG